MSYVVVGLGNPDTEHTHNRHNAGRMLLLEFAKKQNFSDWEEDKKAHALITDKKMGKEQVTLLLPETYMNKSGTAVAKYVKGKKQMEHFVLCYDDFDLPLGTMRIAFGRGSGGHNGVASVIKSLGSKDFIRLRIGVAPTTPSGKIKKPQGEEKVLKYLMGDFSEKDKTALRAVFKKAQQAIEMIVGEGRVAAMNQYN